jgi:hypothetical protein
MARGVYIRDGVDVPVNRHSFPNGHTRSAMLKALLKYLDATKGAAAADDWLKVSHIERDDLEDETRPQPLSGLHTALEAFVAITSRDAIAKTSPYLIASDNLGGWMRVLRGTSTPAEAFGRLDSSDSEYGRTTRWETIASVPGSWRGRVFIAHDPALEEDGLLQLSRMVHLSVVPELFGFGHAAVKPLEGPRGRGALSQEFEVTWPVASALRTSAILAFAGGIVGAAPLAISPSLGAVGWAVVGLGAGGVVGLALERDRARRTESFAQAMRVRALERSLLLRETRENQASGALEGSIVAGQYRIARRMGSGASGVIFQAVRTSDGLPVAIKLLRTVAAHDAVASDRLRREAEALRLAWHPNVVEVLDHGVLGDGTAYLVMELLDGEPLSARIRSKSRLSPHEVLPIATQVCDALVAVHAAGVVHRDLKPSNIFLSKIAGEPAGERVKLIDFGIARVEWEETRITNTGSPVGTPGYMSPEQETGGEIDARSDIFALGACIYESLVGEPPPPTPSGLWVASPAPGVGAPRSSDSALNKAGNLIPPPWRPVLERAMAPLPRDRYSDARAFGQALRELGATMTGSGGALSSR